MASRRSARRSPFANIARDAKARGELDPHDVRRGSLAIEAMAPQLGTLTAMARARRFAIEMRHLEKSLELAPAKAELETLRGQLAKSTDAAERARLTAQYRAKANALPEVYRLGALDALAETSGATRKQPVFGARAR